MLQMFASLLVECTVIADRPWLISEFMYHDWQLALAASYALVMQVRDACS